MADKSVIVIACVAVIALVVAVVALLLSAVALSQSGTSNINISSPYFGQSRGTDNAGYVEDKIWLLAFDETGLNFGYIDDATGELRGFSIDMANAVCQVAHKNCEIVYDSSQRCWDSTAGARSQGGEGLFGGYYDGCVGWVHSYDRPRTFRFSDPYIDNLPEAALLTLKGNPGNFNWRNLTGSTIGFVDGFVYDEHCLARTDVVGNQLKANQIVHYTTRPAAQQGLRDNQVDAIFDANRIYLRNAEFQIVSDNFETCVKAGFSVMTRKDSRLIDWWNPAFAKLAATSQWKAICNDLIDEHGHVGGGGPTSCVGID